MGNIAKMLIIGTVVATYAWDMSELDISSKKTAKLYARGGFMVNIILMDQ